jgi:xylose isomerase
MLKLAIITGFLSQTKDRFHAYNAPLSLDEKFALMSTIEGYSGVEIVYPYEVKEVAATREALARHSLQVAAVNVNVKAEPEFRNGGLRSPAVPWATVTNSPSNTTTPWLGNTSRRPWPRPATS